MKHHKNVWGKDAPPPELWDKLKLLAREKRHTPTPAEESLWQRLRDNQLGGYNFRRQHALGRFIVDFYCRAAKLVIEVDGSIHEQTPVEDALRQAYLESLGLRVIRFLNDEVLNEITTVLDRIRQFLRDNPA